MSEKNILYSRRQPVINPCKTVGEYYWKKLAQLDDHFVCVIDARNDERLTIGSLKSQANSIAVALLKRGVTKEDLITFYGPNTIQHVVLRFVAYFLGLTFMPLSPTYEKYEVELEYKSAGSNIIFSHVRDIHKFSGIIEGLTKEKPKLVVVFDGNHERFVAFEQLLEEGRDQSLQRIPHSDVNPEKDMMCLIHTSGSTGRPKCAMIPHRAILLCGEDQIFFSGGIKGSTLAQVCPLGHISGTTIIPISIVSGTTNVLFADFDEELYFKSIEKYKIDVLPLFPQLGKRVIESKLVDKYDLSTIKIAMTAGAKFPENISRTIIDKYGAKFYEGYGMTESMLLCVPDDVDEQFIPGNVGRPGTGYQLKFADLTTGEGVGPNIDGEICVKGDKVFCGYLRDGEVSLEAFDSEGWYRTGDLGHYDETGRVFITDRLKEVIRIGVDNHYINISPVEIESFLLTLESIAEVAVVGVTNKSGTHWPRAYVVLREGITATEEEIQKSVKDTLAYTKQLKGGVIFVDSINKTLIGKVDRKYYRNLVNNEVID